MATHNHYHVLSGLTGGYMPNDNVYCRTLRDAQASAAWLAASYRDDVRVTGSARSRWYDVGDNEYIEITECNEPDCDAE